MNNDLISREALKQEMKIANAEAIDYEMLVDMYEKLVDNAPTVEQFDDTELQRAIGYADGYSKGREERPQGEWVFDGCDDVTCKCMFCGHEHVYLRSPKADGVNFCEQCGADMRGSADCMDEDAKQASIPYSYQMPKDYIKIRLDYSRPQGKWINHRNDYGHNIADCSLCGKTMQWHDEDEDGIPRYCWYCGASMEGGAK